MKPLYIETGRTILRVEKLIKKDKDGNEYQDISREATVVSSTSEELKKGSKVYYNPRGCVNVEALSTKKYMLLAVDNIDIYVTL